MQGDPGVPDWGQARLDADLVAFILNFNKYPISQKELPTEFEALKAIKITAPK